MPSRADGRLWLERACRAGTVVAIVLLAWRAGVPRDGREARATSSAELPGALALATRSRVPAMELRLDSIPGPAHRAWAAAIAHSGTAVAWSASDSLPALTVALESLVDPQGGARVTAIAPPGTALRLVDSVGAMDSSIVSPSGLRVVESMTAGGVRGMVSRSVASPQSPDSLQLRPVLVVARAGWEGRFTAAALQEAGWRVEVDYQVTNPALPDAGSGADVRTPEAALPIDTSRFSAVVALDESATSRAAALVRFVRAGGGVVLGAAAAATPALAALAASRPGESIEGKVGGLLGTTPRSGLPARALSALPDDALVLERRGGAIVIAARRVALGRTLVLGYEDTWRWRMEGGPTSQDDHRAWWSGLVGSVARPILLPHAIELAADPAPYAALVEALGAPREPAGVSLPPRIRWEPWLLLLSLALLMTEWTSRRTRGVT